jgi:oligoribonuclease (3'-5' exoribonuclease)
MRYSKWAQQNKLRLGINASEKEDEKVVQMNDMEARNKAVRGLLEKAKSNRGEATDAERQRADAVNFLAGKSTSQKTLRPAVKDLLNGGR